jgi:hypothetical protein
MPNSLNVAEDKGFAISSARKAHERKPEKPGQSVLNMF